MHLLILQAAFAIAAAHGAGEAGSRAPLKDLEFRPAIALEPVAGSLPAAIVIKPPACLDLKMAVAPPNVGEAMTVLGLNPGAVEEWRKEVARCARVASASVELTFRPGVKF